MTFLTRPVFDAAELVAAGQQLVDVREAHETAWGMLPGAVNIPLSELTTRLGELDRTRPVALVCQKGQRSAMAAEYLARCGFGQVTNLAGGMDALAAG